MTHPGNDPAPMWLKMVPDSDPNAEGFWTRRLIRDHHVIMRSREPQEFAETECPVTFRFGEWDPVRKEVRFDEL